MKAYPVTARNKVKRVPDRGHYDTKTLYSILDSAFVCHVSFNMNGQPFIIPMGYGRKGNKLYLHGATSSRLMKSLKTGIPVGVAVTQLDGVVLARSVFHSSMNYRSAVVFGKAVEIEDNKKVAALKILSDQIAKGRWEEARKPNRKELKATSVLEVTIEEASSKIRTGPAKDDKEDYDLPIWAGVIPLKISAGKIETDPGMRFKMKPAKSANDFKNRVSS